MSANVKSWLGTMPQWAVAIMFGLTLFLLQNFIRTREENLSYLMAQNKAVGEYIIALNLKVEALQAADHSQVASSKELSKNVGDLTRSVDRLTTIVGHMQNRRF